MKDLISRQAAIDALCSVCGVDCDKSEFVYDGKQEDQVILCPEHYVLTQLPSAQPERKKGKWEEKHHAYADEEKVIEEWQSCRCSVCGRYDTRPYMYYFDEPHFCSWCGADMRGEKHETN